MARITYRKTRKGETITMRADRGEDLRGVIEQMARPTDDRPALTADTITDEQVRELHADAFARCNWDVCCLCHDATFATEGRDREFARARCADLLNARKEQR